MLTKRDHARLHGPVCASFVTLLAAAALTVAGASLGRADDGGHGGNGPCWKDKGKHKGKDKHDGKPKKDECEDFEIVPFADTRMIIEFNSTDEDVGVQFFLDAEGWQSVKVYDPEWEKIFAATVHGALRKQGGGSELFLESVEPELGELPLEKFFARFPEGKYNFVGTAPGCVKLVGAAEFSHLIPAGPEIIAPVSADEEECAEGVAIPAFIDWKRVTKSIDGEPVETKGYEVIVESDDRTFDVFLDADVTQVRVPSGFLDKGEEYSFEVLAIEEGGNQTISSGCFVTAP